MMNRIRALFGALLLLPGVLRAQQRHEIVRGRVTSDSGAPLRGADVIVTRTVDRVAKSTTTAPNGEYLIDWPDGSGDYAVTVTATGFQTRTIHAVRAADSVIVADLSLQRAAQQLRPVVTQARRPMPDRDPATYAAGGTEAMMFPQNAARRLPPDQAGDLNAIAAMLPGVAIVPGGISVLGLGAGQNSVTLNGLAFAGADVPRDAATRVRVTASSYDPANGWFSGAQTAVDLTIGNQFAYRNSHVTVDAPALQYTDRISARSGQQFTNFNVGLGGNGQLVDDKWAYNYGFQGGRKSSDVASLLTADSDLLTHAGVAPDSALRLLALLGQAGIPLTTAGLPSGTVDENVSFIGRIDHAPYDWAKLAYNRTTYGLQGYGKWSRSEALGMNPLAAPAHGGQSTQTIAQATAFYTTFFANDFLADLKSGLTLTRNTTDPYLALPDGRALVVSSLPGGGGGVSTVQFGGSSNQSDSKLARWETNAQVQLYPPGYLTHRVKLAADARYDATSQDLLGNSLGTFNYSSLASIAAGQPSSFTRTLSSPTRTSGEWNAFASAADLWRANEHLQLIYGVRLDGNQFTRLPARNPAVETAFGLRTNRGPNSIDLSPRAGFTWQDGAGRTVRGGFGQFRNLVDPSLLAAPSVLTGLAGGLLQIACFGSAVPVPNWAAYGANPASAPTQCANGSGALVDAAPNVQMVSTAYRPQRSWRGNLAYQSSAFKNVFSVEGIASLNRDQPGTFDDNLRLTPVFSTSDEARPVLVPASSIVPASGVTAPAAARTNASFGRVVSAVSDLRSVSKAAVVTLRPYVPEAIRPHFGDLNLAYTLTFMRAQQRGFDGGTFGDPSVKEWARGDFDARHLLVGQMVFRPMGDGRALLFLYGRVMSGLPFTPMVSGDVNGDGLANDRAFVFALSANDPTVGRGMTALLATAPTKVRNCLVAQLGQVATRNSCEGPWTAQLNASLRLSGQQLLHTPRMDVTINLANPLGGIDQLLHGNNLRGWGTSATPDRMLYVVRGFDPVSNRYLYDVNQRLGSTSPSASTIRAPFRLTLDVAVDIGRSIPDQMLDRWLRPGRSGRPGDKMPAPEFFRRFQRTVPDPYTELLPQSDSLLLTSDQVSLLQAADARYRTRVDAMWTAVAQYLGTLPDTYDFDAASKRVDQTTDEVWEVTRRDVQQELAAILSPAQTAQLGGFAGMLFRARDPVHIRLTPR